MKIVTKIIGFIFVIILALGGISLMADISDSITTIYEDEDKFYDDYQ